MSVPGQTRAFDVPREGSRYPCSCNTRFPDEDQHAFGCLYGGILPAPGERPTFGQHRLPEAERAEMGHGRTSR